MLSDQKHTLMIMCTSFTQIPFQTAGAIKQEALAENVVYSYFFNSSQRKQFFAYEGLQQLSMELKHLKPLKAFRPDYYMFSPNLPELIILNVTSSAS